jgi:hypothetical protein
MDVCALKSFWAACGFETPNAFLSQTAKSLFEQGRSGDRLSSEPDLHVLTSTPIVTALSDE